MQSHNNHPFRATQKSLEASDMEGRICLHNHKPTKSRTFMLCALETGAHLTATITRQRKQIRLATSFELCGCNSPSPRKKKVPLCLICSIQVTFPSSLPTPQHVYNQATASLDASSAGIDLFCHLMPPASTNARPCTATWACCFAVSTPNEHAA